MEKGMEEGMEKGMEKGKAEEKQQIARNMKSFGLAPEAIAKMTGLSLEEINRL